MLGTRELALQAGERYTANADLLFENTETTHFSYTDFGVIEAGVSYKHKDIEGLTAHAVDPGGSVFQFRTNQGTWPAQWDGVALVNMGSSTNLLTVHQYDSSGNQVAQRDFGPLGSLAKQLIVFNDHFETHPGGYFEILAEQPMKITGLRGSQVGASPAVMFQIQPAARLSQGTTRWLGHITPPDSVFETMLEIANPNSRSTTLILKTYDPGGEPLEDITVPVEASSRGVISFNDFSVPATHARITLPDDLEIRVGYRKKGVEGNTAFWAPARASRYFVVAAGEPGAVWDGFAIANTGDTPVSVKIRYDVPASGHSQEHDLATLGGYAKALFLPAEHFELPRGRILHYRGRR